MAQPQTKSDPSSKRISFRNHKRISYVDRSRLCSNPVAKQLFTIMDQKKSNLALAADVTTKKELLQLAEMVGPYICVFKTHIDIIEDFDWDLIDQLQVLAKKHNFLLFEDRKFADIGNTVKKQYSSGIYKIADWADIVNAHTVPGPGIIKGLQEIGAEKNRALLLLPQMSSKGTLAQGSYTEKTIAMAKEYADFVIGFISRELLTDDPRFIHFTPGVKLQERKDSLGQQYLTPQEAIERGADIIIVGRGIYQADDVAQMAKKYRDSAWEAYKNKI